jgi:hypothetical protein
MWMVLFVMKQILYYYIWLIVLVFYVLDGFVFFIKLYRHYPYICLKKLNIYDGND